MSEALGKIIARCVQLKISDRFADANVLLAEVRPLWLSFQSARCTCGHQNAVGSRVCAACQRSLVRPRGWQARYPGPFRFQGKPPFELAWTTDLGEPVRGSAVLEAGNLWVATQGGHLVRLDMEGQILEKRWVGAGSRSSPLIHQGQVWLGTAQGLLTPQGLLPLGEVFAVPAKAGAAMHVLTYKGHLHKLSNSYESLWQHDLKGEGISSPLPIGNRVLASVKEGDVFCFAGDGDLRWKVSLGALVYGSLVVSQGHVLVLDHRGRVGVLELSTGRKILQQGAVGTTYCGLVGSADRWIAADKFGLVVGLDSGFAEVWRVGLDSEVVASPCIVGDWVVVGTRGGQVGVLELATGKKVYPLQLGGEFVAPWVADGNALFGVTKEGHVYCLV